MDFRSKVFSDLAQLASLLPSHLQLFTILNECSAVPCLSSLQDAERVLHQLESARRKALELVADLAAEYIAKGGEPR